MEEIRAIKPGEIEEFNRLTRISFAAPPEFTSRIPEDWTLCMFVDGKMANTFAFYPLKMEFNGKQTSVSGVSMVTSLPVFRRRGHLRKLMKAHFQNLHEKGERSIAALFASMTAIYQRFGYGIVSSKNQYSFHPNILEYALETEESGYLTEANENDNKLLLDLYHEFCKGRTGYLHRNEKMEVAESAPLTIYLFPIMPNKILNKIIYWENKKPLGYLIYSIVPGQMGQQIMINDMVWLSISAYNSFWKYLSRMDLAQEINWQRVPLDDPLPHLLLDPRKLNVKTSDGLLARIIDVEKAVLQRGYYEEGELLFEVIDDFCPWNSGTYKLETSASGSISSQTKQSPQVSMPVSTLSMLLFGQISATEASRMGRIDVYDEKALRLWDRVMKTEYKPFCDDMF